MRYHGIFRGICVDNLDPMAHGRVRVNVPAAMGDGDHRWAVPCRALGSPGGAPPSIGTAVWVMFEGGNPDYPVVIGTIPE